MLIDDHGRKIRKLRLSLTDRCNLRCHYCMPVDQVFQDESKNLSDEELVDILSELHRFGLEELRLTGGEPLLRKSFSEMVDKIGALHFKKVGLTTNGILLDKYFDVLERNQVFHLNISLDSLEVENFKRITFGNYFEKVIQNIKLAKKRGFEIKINTVIMKGINDHELIDFIHFSNEIGVEVRFLELMRIGYACSQQKEQFISAQEMIGQIKKHFTLKSISMPQDSTSYNFITNTNAHIGFIASESEPFCGHCSRWRLSSDGVLRACLLKDEGLSLKNKNLDERFAIYKNVLGMKPYLRPAEVKHYMNAIGG